MWPPLTRRRLWDCSCFSSLEGYQERVLAPSGADTHVKELLDPTFQHNQKKYQRLGVGLHRRGLVRPLDYCCERVASSPSGR